MPLRVEPDGTLVLAGADPGADLRAAGRPARLVLTSAEAIDRLLGDVPAAAAAPPAPAPQQQARPDAPAPAAPPSPLTMPIPLEAQWDAVTPWPPPAPRRWLRPWALLGLVLLALAITAAVLIGPRGADTAPAGLVQADLPAGVRAEVAATGASRERALAAACAGRPSIVAAPLRAVPCTLVPAAEVTVGATILLAPGGGCVPAARARGLAAALRDRPEAPRPAGARVVAVRPDRGGACVSADETTLRAGLYPLVRRAAVVVRPSELGSAAAVRLARALRAAEARAPVTTLVVSRAVS